MRHLTPQLVTFALFATLPLLAGCGRGERESDATPLPTVGRVSAAKVPTATITPLPSQTPLPSLTPIPVDSPTPEGPSLVLGPEDYGSNEMCEILRTPELIDLVVVPWAADEARASVDMDAMVFVAEVSQHDNLARQYLLKPTDPDVLPEFALSYSGEPLPIELGGSYTFHWNQDGLDPPGSTVLRIDDETDVLFLSGRVKAGTVGFAGPHTPDPLLAADMGGFVVRQLPTLCQHSETDPCGFESRAARLEASRGAERVGRPAGESGVMPSDPPYRLTVFTSHVRRWAHSSPGMECVMPDDWPQSWRLERVLPEPAE